VGCPLAAAAAALRPWRPWRDVILTVSRSRPAVAEAAMARQTRRATRLFCLWRTASPIFGCPTHRRLDQRCNLRIDRQPLGIPPGVQPYRQLFHVLQSPDLLGEAEAEVLLVRRVARAFPRAVKPWITFHGESGR
jgi:hypothetical protein